MPHFRAACSTSERMLTAMPTAQTTVTEPAREYLLGHSSGEIRRLILQHQLYAPTTRRLFEAAGIGRGMRVLDIGSGAGDVALLLADLVGPTGRVIGIDRNETALQTARARADAAGWRNITFKAVDVWHLEGLSGLDAVVGRWILMHLDRQAELIRALATLLRPGGIVAFLESDFSMAPRSVPDLPLAKRTRDVLLPRDLPGVPDAAMGSKLFQVFLDAGLPAPELRLEAPMGGGPDWPGYEYTAETLRSLMPVLQRLVDVDPSTLDVDSLAERLRAEAVEHRAVEILPVVIGAWTRKAA